MVADPWAVLQTQHQRERTALENVTNQGYEAYLPLCRLRRGSRILTEALFPRYLFVQLADTWASLWNTKGVSRVLMDGHKPALVCDSEVRSIQSRQGGDGVIDLNSSFKLHEALHVRRGPMTGVTGSFSHLRGKDRVVLLLDALGQSVPVEVRERDVVRAAA